MILAAGASRRMGQNKMLLAFGGEPLVRRAVRAARGAGLTPIIVVVGHEAANVAQAVSDLAPRIAENPNYEGPTSTSLHEGLSQVPADAAGVVVLLGDMLNVTDQMLSALLIAARRTAAPLVASRYGEVIAPPFFFSRELFGELLAWRGEGAGPALAQRHRERAVFVDWPRNHLADVDTPGDVARFSVMTQDMVVLVDADDHEVGSAEKLAVHREGRLHRAFSVFLHDGQGRLLLQRRASHKYHSGGLWSNTCCGHPRPGEATNEAARRRLREEMGVDTDLEPVISFVYREEVGQGLVEHELDHVFVGRIEGAPQPNPEEVSEWRWVKVEDLRADLGEHPDRYTVWLKPALEGLIKGAARFLGE
ncbi:MAG TPA: isopentenyl-diphosphate Delta-isomerase [Gemmatimonadales bacterium]|nr:isopentenyl-diphosphate Delta-isomerase [Gemmatimonadales bacterium]